MRRLAYLTNVYPSISHTFIRRELQQVEKRGYSVLRVSIRPPADALRDPQDIAEQKQTLCCLAQPRLALLRGSLKTLVTRPRATLRSFRTALSMGWRSGAGMLRHLAYMVEAMYLLQVFRRERIEHVHVHFGTNPATVARLVRKLGGPSYSFVVHGPQEFDAPIALDLAGKVSDAAFVTAISSFGSAQLRRWVPRSQWSKIHVVRCMVADEFLTRAKPINPGSRSLVCVGRLTSQKAPLLLVEALGRLAAEGVEGSLLLVGDGELRGEIENWIQELGLHDRVEITGYLTGPEVRERLLDARALVLPSYAEGLPVVIMEALALARPVISTYVAGIPELVRPGINGWLVPAGDVDALTEAMRAVLEAPVEQLEAMGAAGRRLVSNLHGPESVLEDLEPLFQKVLSDEQVSPSGRNKCRQS